MLFARERLPGVAGRVIAGKYVLDRALAAGGMGSVWAAWNTQLDVPVAIKFMAPGLASSTELVARFEREARAAAQIRSAQVVQIFEHGVDEGQPFIVMELLEGEDLGQRIRREGRLSVSEIARVVHEVCRALRRAHALGIIHRDLKPANIFLARGDDDEEDAVKVLDFGVVKSIAEAVESGVTKTGELIGTPHYMSPEQARSVKSVDHRSDLWSLAVIAYRALTASLPFPDEEGIEMLLRVCTEPAPKASSFAPDLGPEVDAFFAKALAIDPADRFQTAREMAEAMNRLAGVPASSRRGILSSIPDAMPPSSRAYPSHAYVYTSASNGQPAHIPQARGSSPSRGSSLPEIPIASAPRPDPLLSELPTRISAAVVAGPPRSGGAPRRVPVAIVTASGMEDTAPGPAHRIEDEGSTMSRGGLERAAASVPARLLMARPQLPLAAAGAVVLFALAIALSPFDRRPDDRAIDRPPAQQIHWQSALGAELPATSLLAPPPPQAPIETAPAPAPDPSVAPIETAKPIATSRPAPRPAQIAPRKNGAAPPPPPIKRAPGRHGGAPIRPIR